VKWCEISLKWTLLDTIDVGLDEVTWNSDLAKREFVLVCSCF